MFNRNDEEYIRTEEEYTDVSETDYSDLSDNSDTLYKNSYYSEADSESIFRETLEANETLLWSAKKSKVRTKTEKESVHSRLMMSIVWTALSAFVFLISLLEVEGTMNNGIGIVVGGLFTLIGIWLLATSIPKKNIYYAITDQRVIVYSKNKKQPFKSYALFDISNPHIVRDKNGSGSGIIEFQFSHNIEKDGRIIATTHNDIVLYSIDDVDNVYDILNSNLSII